MKARFNSMVDTAQAGALFLYSVQ
ncbi:MAG: hypothetical protein H6Q84_3433, partial [Deltaproteobacteria bacterium]|nr:hypothetical protein [Deltaproteobacteria bacterium]